MAKKNSNDSRIPLRSAFRRSGKGKKIAVTLKRSGDKVVAPLMGWRGEDTLENWARLAGAQPDGIKCTFGKTVISENCEGTPSCVDDPLSFASKILYFGPSSEDAPDLKTVRRELEVLFPEASKEEIDVVLSHFAAPVDGEKDADDVGAEIGAAVGAAAAAVVNRTVNLTSAPAKSSADSNGATVAPPKK